MKLSRTTSLLLVAVGLLVCQSLLGATTNPAALPQINTRTNSTPGRFAAPAPGAAPPAGTKANPVQPAASKTTQAASGTWWSSVQTTAVRLWAGLVENFRRLRARSAFFPVLIGLGLGGLLVYQYVQSKSKAAGDGGTKLGGKAAKSGVAGPVTSCNVLLVGEQSRQVWKFDARGGSFALSREQTCRAGESLPRGIVARDWRSLWQPKLNIAWFPPEQVFLRVAQFPLSDFNETLAMVELQLEKLSPMPVAQIVWTLHVLPHPKGNMQTVILMIVGRSAVEEFLGKLEGQGYLADRLELPMLDQLQATAISGDGAWIYPTSSSRNSLALVAWWYGGVLQNLDLVTLPAVNAAEGLKEQLVQMAWAGEMEGWLTRAPGWHLVAEPAIAAEWEPVLSQAVEQTVEASAPLPASQLAGLTARRAAAADPRANLLPPEFSIRYKEQFYDRLWMGSLFAVGGLYLAGVLIYMSAVGVAGYRTRGVETEVASLATAYTNALQLKARYKVLKDRQDLTFAALDCWNAVAETMPDTLTLDSCIFSEGKSLTLNGTAPNNEAAKQVYEFEAALRKTSKDRDGQILFDPTRGDHANWRMGAGGTLSWSMKLELKRAEAE